MAEAKASLHVLLSMVSLLQRRKLRIRRADKTCTEHSDLLFLQKPVILEKIMFM